MPTNEKDSGIDAVNLATKATGMGLLVGLTTFPFSVLIGLRQSGRELAFRSVAKSFPPHLAASQTKGVARNTGSAVKKSASSEAVSSEPSAQIPTEHSQPTAATSPLYRPAMPLPVSRHLFLNQTLSHVDALLGGYFANRSKLEVAGKETGQMNPRNMWALTKAGYPLRWASATIFYGALIKGVDEVAAALPITDPTVKAATAGALTGIATTLATYPLQEAHDRQILATSIDENGRLQPLSTMRFFRIAKEHIENVGTRAATKDFFAKGTLRLRAASGAAAFATAQLANDWLGDTTYDDAQSAFSRKA